MDFFVAETVNINGVEVLSNIQGHSWSPRTLFPQNGSADAAWCVWLETRNASASIRAKLLRFESEQIRSYSSLSKLSNRRLWRQIEGSMSSYPDLQSGKSDNLFSCPWTYIHTWTCTTRTNNSWRKVNDRSDRRFTALFGTCFGTGTLTTLRDLMILVTQQCWLVEALLQKQTVCSHQLINHPNDRQFRKGV